MSDAPAPEAPEADFEKAEDPSFFQGNKRVRLGRSRDQDGKSNIWSIEPKMEVEEGEDDGGKKNFVILGGILGAVAVCVPAFLALTQIMPDPSDF